MSTNSDQSPSQAEIFQGLAQSVSRRSFLGRGVAAAAVPAALAVGASEARAQSLGSFPSLYSGSNRRNFAEIRADENAHVSIITFAIQSIGGTPRPKPTFRNLRSASATLFAQTAVVFENLGVQAYFAASPFIFNPNVLAVASSIAFVEAYHSGFLNTLLNLPLTPNGQTYITAATLQQITTAVTPFIVSLNDNGQFPVGFSTTPSAANDVAILNLALILEYLEAEFYNINVSRFLPGA